MALPVPGQTRSQEDTPPTEEVGQLDTRAGLLCLLLLLHESVEDSSGCEAGAVHGEMDEVSVVSPVIWEGLGRANR